MKEEFIWKFSEYLSIHLRCESHAGSFVTCTRAKQEEPYLVALHSRCWWTGGTPSVSRPTFEQVEALYQAFVGQHILICRNLAFHHGPTQFCNVTDRCVHYPSPFDPKPAWQNLRTVMLSTSRLHHTITLYHTVTEWSFTSLVHFYDQFVFPATSVIPNCFLMMW